MEGTVMNTYINMMKKAKCNDEAVAILRKIKTDIKEPEEMKKTMKETMKEIMKKA